jgi:uncharacterized protein
MALAPTTIIDLARLSLAPGEGKRLDSPVRLEPLELGGQEYQPKPEAPTVRLDISRPSSGYAFRIRFPIHIEGPCMRCLEPASLDLDVESREVDSPLTDAEELRSPYVTDEELDIGRWAHDAAILALPNQLLCRPDCKGLCTVCGEPLNNADPADHKHGQDTDPRWSKLKDLKLE